MRDDRYTSLEAKGTVDDGLYRFVIVTLDAHAAGPAQRVAGRLAKDFPGIAISVHAAAEWAENPAALAQMEDLFRRLRDAGLWQTRRNSIAASLDGAA